VYRRPVDGSYTISGRGFGHGIGMSQYGAHGAGLAGLTHGQILSYYYSGTRLDTLTFGPG
jgi:SpoIID/LytB domain protein